VLDVKTGSGAFMKTTEASRHLAEALVAIGAAAGVRTEAMISRMESPLGRSVGNANEVIESIETLKGGGPMDLEGLSVRLTARMLIVAGLARDEADADARVRQALASGAGVETFRRIIENQGGDPRVVDDYGRLPATPDRSNVAAGRAGYVGSIDAEMVGRAAVALGAGRERMEDAIDHAVVSRLLRPWARPREGDEVLVIRHRAGRGLDAATTLLRDAVRIADERPVDAPLIIEHLESRGR
jgi:thymidine phosphorylase